MGRSEKLNLDPRSGEDSMEKDVLERKHIGSKPDEDEAGNKREKTEVTARKEEQTRADVLGDDVVDDKDIKVENSQQSVLAVKRKLNDGGNGSNEPLKRPRKWKSDGVRVPEPQGSNRSAASTPKHALQTPTSRRGRFSRSDFAAKKPVVWRSYDRDPTNSLRIDRFQSPFKFKRRDVQELLERTGTVKSFWMDDNKSHCYVTYSSVEEAMKTKNAVDGLQWPPKVGYALVAAFVEPREVMVRLGSPPRARARAAAWSAHPPELQLPLRPPFVPETIVPQEEAAGKLSDLFRKTKATPVIYYLPLSEEQVAAKLSVRGKAPRQ